MTTFNDYFAAYAAPQHSEYFGETVTQYPLGVTASAANVDDCWFHELPAAPDIDRGREILRRAELSVPLATTLDAHDRWIIRSEEWQVLSIGNTEGERRMVQLQRNETDIRSKSGGKVR